MKKSETHHDDTMRGTGRTTGLMLKAIGEALRFPASEVEFKDHHRMTIDSAKKMRRDLQSMADRLGLRIVATVVGNRIFVRSNIGGPGNTESHSDIAARIMQLESVIEQAQSAMVAHIGLCRHYNERTADHEGCDFCPSFDHKTCAIRRCLAGMNNPKAWEASL